MPKPISPWVLSTLSYPIWMTATDSPHVNAASGVWLYFDSSLAQFEFSSLWLRAGEWQRLAEHCGPAKFMTQAADAQSDTGSPHPTGAGPRLAIWYLQSRCQSLIIPACLGDTALCWGHPTGCHSSLSHLFTSSSNSDLSPAQGWAHGTPKEPIRCGCWESRDGACHFSRAEQTGTVAT